MVVIVILLMTLMTLLILTKMLFKQLKKQKQEIKEVSQDEVIKDVITDENPDNENNKLLENRVPPALVQSNIEENSSNQAVEEKIYSYF